MFSILNIPCLIAAAVSPFLTTWWALLPCLGLAWFFTAMSYRYQREAVRQLVLEDPSAFALLSLEGVIHVDERKAPV